MVNNTNSYWSSVLIYAHHICNDQLIERISTSDFQMHDYFKQLKSHFITKTKLTTQLKSDIPEYLHRYPNLIDIIYNNRVAICLLYGWQTTKIVVLQSYNSNNQSITDTMRFLVRYYKEYNVPVEYGTFAVFKNLPYSDIYNVIEKMLISSTVEYNVFRTPLQKLIKPTWKNIRYYPSIVTNTTILFREMVKSYEQEIDNILSTYFDLDRKSYRTKIDMKRIRTTHHWVTTGRTGTFAEFVTACEKIRIWNDMVDKVWRYRFKRYHTLYVSTPFHLNGEFYAADHLKDKLVELYYHDESLYKYIMYQTKLLSESNIKEIELYIETPSKATMKDPSNKTTMDLYVDRKYAEWGESEIMFPEDPELRWRIKNALRYDDAKYDSFESKRENFY